MREDTVIATIADISKLRLALYVPEMAAARVKLGDTVRFVLPALSSRHFEAKIFYMSTVADPQTHMFECKADIPQPDPEMKPGLFARVQLATEQHPDAFVVSEEAIRASERGFVVFVPEERHENGRTDWVARSRTVQTGLSQSGLRGGLVRPVRSGRSRGDPRQRVAGKRHADRIRRNERIGVSSRPG